jgi:hypothetical protein
LKTLEEGGIMSQQALFEAMYGLSEQLKGAPLREDERNRIVEEFNEAAGPPFDRAITAVAGVLHAERSLIFEKSEALEVVNNLLEDVKRKAAVLEQPERSPQP